MLLADRVAVITGAGRGIGRSIALAFAREGAQVALAARSAAQLVEVADEAQRLGRRALALATDVTDEAAVGALVERTQAVFGRIDILVNNAGIMRLAAVVATEPEMWRETLDANLTSAFLCARAVLPIMMAQGSGNIINIASRAGKVATPMGAAYSASKFGLIGLTKALSEEVKQMGIRVNAICPGFVDTKLVEDSGVRSMLDAIMHPDEIAAAAVFLASDASSSITGADIEAYGITERPRL